MQSKLTILASMASTMKAWRTYKYNEDGPAAIGALKLDLKAMVKLFEEGKLKVCVDEHFGFDEVKEALSKSLTARSGGKLVIDVASPAPSETCCVVA